VFHSARTRRVKILTCAVGPHWPWLLRTGRRREPTQASALSRPKGRHGSSPILDRAGGGEACRHGTGDYVSRATGVVTKVCGEDLAQPNAADAYLGAAAYTQAARLYREKLDRSHMSSRRMREAPHLRG